MQQSLLSYMRKLRNHRFAEAYELICTNLQVEELTAPHVKQAVEEVQEYARSMELLKNQKRQHPISQQLFELKKERHQYLLSIRGRIAYFMRSHDPQERIAANTLQLWINSYHEFLRGASIHDQSRLVSNMTGEIEQTAEINAAFRLLGLISTMEAIELITADMRTLHLRRLNDKKATAAKTDRIKNTAYARLSTLWKTLEVGIALRTADEAECRQLFDSVTWVIIDFKARYLDTITRRETAKLKAEDDAAPDPAEV